MTVRCHKCGKEVSGKGQLGTHLRTCGIDMSVFFWAKVNKEAPEGCWEWTASRKEKGYGQFFWRGKMYRAHRLAWKLSGHELPKSPLELAHTCDNRICVNPAHLYVATHEQNMKDCYTRRRHTYGVRNHSAKLTEAQALEILLAKGTAPAKVVASKYPNATKEMVGAIWRRQSWKHLTPKL